MYVIWDTWHGIAFLVGNILKYKKRRYSSLLILCKELFLKSISFKHDSTQLQDNFNVKEFTLFVCIITNPFVLAQTWFPPGVCYSV